MTLRYCPENLINLNLKKLSKTPKKTRSPPQNTTDPQNSSPLGEGEANGAKASSHAGLFYICFPQLVGKASSERENTQPPRRRKTSPRTSEPDGLLSHSRILNQKKPTGKSNEVELRSAGSQSMHCFVSNSGASTPRQDVARRHRAPASSTPVEDRATELQKLRRSLDVPVTSLQWIKKKPDSFPNVWQTILKYREEKEMRKARAEMENSLSAETDMTSQGRQDLDDIMEVKTGEAGDHEPDQPKSKPVTGSSEEFVSAAEENSEFCIKSDVPCESHPKSKTKRKGRSLTGLQKWNNPSLRNLSEIVYSPYSLNPEVKAPDVKAANHLMALELEVKCGAGDLGKLPTKNSEFLQTTVSDGRGGASQSETGKLLSQKRQKPRSASVSGSATNRPQPGNKNNDNSLCSKVSKSPAQKYHGCDKDMSTTQAKKRTVFRTCLAQSEELSGNNVAWECHAKGYEIIRKIWRGKIRPYSQIYLSNNKHNLEFCPVEITAVRQPYAHFTSSVLALTRARSKRRYAHKWINALPTHENLLMLLHRFSTSNWLYHVTEHCPWPPLSHLILTTTQGWMEDAPRGLEEDACRTIFRQICRGMDHLHSHGVLHGDLNCCNVLVTNDFRVKLAGYGPTCQRMMTVLETLCGHLKVQGEAYDIYAPPEIMSRRNTWTQNCDVWCMGITLLQMTLGSIPPEVNAAVRLSGSVRSLERFGLANCGYQLSRLIDKILQPRPSCRPSVWTISQHTWLVDGCDLVVSIWQEARKRQKRTDGSTFPLPKRLQKRVNRTLDAFYASGSDIGENDCEDNPFYGGDDEVEEDCNNHGGYADSHSSSSRNEEEKKVKDGRRHSSKQTVSKQGRSGPEEEKHGPEQKRKNKRKSKVKIEKALQDKLEHDENTQDMEMMKSNEGLTDQESEVERDRGDEKYDPNALETSGRGDTEGVPCDQSTKSSCHLLKLVENLISGENKGEDAGTNLFNPGENLNIAGRESPAGDVKRRGVTSARRSPHHKDGRPRKPGESDRGLDRRPKVDKFKDLLIVGRSADSETVSCSRFNISKTAIQLDSSKTPLQGCGSEVDQIEGRFKSLKTFKMKSDSKLQLGNRLMFPLTDPGHSLVSQNKIAAHGGGAQTSGFECRKSPDGLGNAVSKLNKSGPRFREPRDKLQTLARGVACAPGPVPSSRLDSLSGETGSDQNLAGDFFSDSSYSEAEQLRRQHFIEDEEEAMREIEKIIAEEERMSKDKHKLH